MSPIRLMFPQNVTLTLQRGVGMATAWERQSRLKFTPWQLLAGREGVASYLPSYAGAVQATDSLASG